MNAPVTNLKGLPQSVTTGPIQGSRKVYASPAGRPDIRVPLREIALSDPSEPAVLVFDSSGYNTDLASGIDLHRGRCGHRPRKGRAPRPRLMYREARLRRRRAAGGAAGGQRQHLGREARG